MQTQPEVKIAAMSFMAFWLITVLIILITGRYSPAIRDFRNRMIAHWKSAMVIAGMYLFGVGIWGNGFLNPYAIVIFCQAMIGLTIASTIGGFQPLPIADAIVRRKQVLRQLILTLVISVLVVVLALLIETIGLDIGRHLFGEANYTHEAANLLPSNNMKLLCLVIL